MKGRAHLSSCVKVVSCAEAGLAAKPSRATIAKARASSVEWEVNEVRCIVRRRRRLQSEEREQDPCLQSTARIESPQRIIAKAGAAKQVREPLRKRVLVLVFAVGEESAGPGASVPQRLTSRDHALALPSGARSLRADAAGDARTPRRHAEVKGVRARRGRRTERRFKTGPTASRLRRASCDPLERSSRTRLTGAESSAKRFI